MGKSKIQFFTITGLYNILFMLSGALNWSIQLCVVSLGSFLVLLYLNSYLKARLLYCVAAILPANIFYGWYTISEGLGHVLPIVFFPVLSFLAFGIYLSIKNNRWKYIWVGGMIVVFTFPTYTFMGYWLNWYTLKQNQEVAVKKLGNGIVFTTFSGDTVDFNKSNDTIYVIDFWTSACGICFQQLPSFKKISMEYASHPGIVFYTANLKLKKDSHEKLNTRILSYFEHNLFIEDSLAFKKLGIRGVPHYMVLRNGEVNFSGNTNIERKNFEHSLVEEIDKLIVNDKSTN